MIVGRMQDEASAGFHRAAAMDLHAADRARQADLGSVGDDVELDQKVAKG